MVNSLTIDIDTLSGKEIEVTILGGYNNPKGYGLMKADFYALWYDSECESQPAGVLTFDDPATQNSYTYAGSLSEYEQYQVSEFIKN